jgi:hypothetical protein
MKETFREGLKKKLKLAIIGMLRTMIVEVVNSTRKIEEEMPTTHRSRKFQPLSNNEDPNEKSTNEDQKTERRKGHKEGECNVWWLTFMSQWCFLLGTPCSKAYGEYYIFKFVNW